MDSAPFLPDVFRADTVRRIELEQLTDQVGSILIDASHFGKPALEDTTENVSRGNIVEGGIPGQPTL